MPTGMRLNGKPPTSPIGSLDAIWGMPGQGGMLSEFAEQVPDLTWPESVRTYARMRRDTKLTAILRAFTLPVTRATWVVDPAGAKEEAASLLAGDLGLPVLGQKGPPPDAAIRGFRWPDHVRLAMLSYVYGFFPFEKWWVVRDGRTHLAGLAERQPHTIANMDIADDGQMRTVEQNTQLQPIPASRLTWYCNEREGANYAGVSLLRPCYSSWVLKHETMRVHATAIRRFGMGVPSVTAPPGATPAQIEQARQLAAGMRAGDQAGAGLPAGFEFTLTGLSGGTPDAVAFLRYLDESMSGSALTGVIELGQTAYGSRALGDTFLDLFLLSLQAVADAIGDTATYGDPAMPGVSRAMTDYNWGESEPCPRIVATDIGDRHEITAAAIQQLLASGAITADDELEAYLREAWSLPRRKTPRPPVPPGGTPGQPSPGPVPGGGVKPAGGGGPAQPPSSPAENPPAPPVPAQAAAGSPDGLRRPLTDVEAAAGLDPLAMRRELETARDRVMGQWAPVLAAQRADLAGQVLAAVDDGHLDRLAHLQADTGDAAEILYRAMAAQAARATGRMIAEAAGQGVTINPAAVNVDHKRLRQLAAARAAMAGQALTQAASRRALQVVTASAGTDAAAEVTTVLAGLSTTPLADQLMAALHTAANEGRMAVLDAGPEAVYTASEINDASTCQPCRNVDGHQFADLADARANYATGAYVDCLGELRCRGTVVATWPQEPPPFPVEAAARWEEWKHPRRPDGKFGRKTGPKRPPHPRKDLLATLSEADLRELDRLDEEHYSAADGDMALAEIARRQGFDARPVTGTPEQLDAEEAAGGVRLFRGVDRPAYATSWITGQDNARQGFGLAGNGTYFATTQEAAQSGYAGSRGRVIEGVLRYDANIADHETLMEDSRAYRRDMESSDPGYQALSDLGRYAALRGYDAIAVDMGTGPPGSGPDTYVLLNRGALLVPP